MKHSANLEISERGKGLKLAEPILLSCYPFLAATKEDAFDVVQDELHRRAEAIEQDELEDCVIIGPVVGRDIPGKHP